MFTSLNVRSTNFRCECNGHGNTCDPITGEKCNCGNNTENEASCQTLSKNSAQPCWRFQCVKCKEPYHGSPKNNHQCYKAINADNRMCFDGRPVG